jgi:carbon storage regulator
MLVLSRRANEQICIGESITVTVLSVKGGRVRLGIQAPQDVDINRQEICGLKTRAKSTTEFEVLVPQLAE